MRFFAPILGLLILTGVVPAQVPNPQEQIIKELKFEQRLGERLPLEAIFVDEEGRPTRLGNLFDGETPAILVLGYFECPMLCGIVHNRLMDTLNEVEPTAGKDFQVISVSIAPGEGSELARKQRNTYLNRYQRDNKAVEGFHFLTGEKDAIDALTNTVGYTYVYHPATNQYAHPSGIVVIASDGKISQYMLGIEYPADQLTEALATASEQSIGSLVRDFVLACFHYDPTEGQYGPYIFFGLRAGAILFVLALVGYITSMILRDRAHRLPPDAGGSQ